LRDRLLDEIRVQPALDRFVLPGDPPDPPPPGLRPVPFLAQDAVDEHGDPVPPEVAAQRLVARLETVRSLPTPEGLDPLGVRTTVNLEVEGLRGEALLLYWRLVADGAAPIPAEWLSWVPAYELTAGTERDTATVSVWVPLPEAPGPYRAELVVMHEPENSPLTSHLTESFGE
jgi:hypothetical protein